MADSAQELLGRTIKGYEDELQRLERQRRAARPEEGRQVAAEADALALKIEELKESARGLEANAARRRESEIDQDRKPLDEHLRDRKSITALRDHRDTEANRWLEAQERLEITNAKIVRHPDFAAYSRKEPEAAALISSDVARAEAAREQQASRLAPMPHPQRTTDPPRAHSVIEKYGRPTAPKPEPAPERIQQIPDPKPDPAKHQVIDRYGRAVAPVDANQKPSPLIEKYGRSVSPRTDKNPDRDRDKE